jgi:hypothetical protein
MFRRNTANNTFKSANSRQVLNNNKTMTQAKPIPPMNGYAKSMKPIMATNNFAKPAKPINTYKSNMNMNPMQSPSSMRLNANRANQFKTNTFNNRGMR